MWPVYIQFEWRDKIMELNIFHSILWYHEDVVKLLKSLGFSLPRPVYTRKIWRYQAITFYWGICQKYKEFQWANSFCYKFLHGNSPLKTLFQKRLCTPQLLCSKCLDMCYKWNIRSGDFLDFILPNIWDFCLLPSTYTREEISKMSWSEQLPCHPESGIGPAFLNTFNFSLATDLRQPQSCVYINIGIPVHSHFIMPLNSQTIDFCIDL
jgi:hypothetical protein